MADRISINLDDDGALVLYALVTRLNEADDPPVVDPAESRVLWDLEADLERTLDVVVADDYEARVLAARSRVRNRV